MTVKRNGAGLASGRDMAGQKPHILVISQYFYPEAFRINDMAAEWVERGYRVTVLTGIPNYPTGKFFAGYGYRQRRKETWNGVEVIRIPLLPRGSSSLGLVANYISFVLSGWWWVTRGGVKADLVFTFEVSPMTQALIGCWYKKKYHVPHFLYVQDLWPENIMAVTGIRSRMVWKPIVWMVDHIYRNTDEIFATSPSFVEEINTRGTGENKDKTHYWPQYAEEFYQPLDRETVRAQAKRDSSVHKIPSDTFNIAFTGNIGEAQGLEILPQAAEKLAQCSCTCSKRVRFVIVGDGRHKAGLEAEIERRGVRDSFLMLPRQPAEAIPDILACCDAAFLSFCQQEQWEMAIPAKLQSYMACGMPVIAAAKGETQRIVEEAGCGVCVGIGDAGDLAKAIRGLVDGNSCKRMSMNSRSYCVEHFSKGKLMDTMDDHIEAATKPFQCPLVSVVVPVYHVKSYIADSLTSIVNQSYGNLEIILVDDGGQDPSVGIAESILRKSGRTYRVIHQSNQGLPRARNVGLEHANGKYVCFIDSDDIIQIDHIQGLITIAEQDRLAIVFSDFEYTTEDDRSGKSDVSQKYEVLSRDDLLLRFVQRKPAVHCCSLLMERTFLEKYQLRFNERLRKYGEDVEFMWRAFPKTKRVGHRKACTYKYLVRDNSIMTSPDAEKWDIFLREFKKTMHREISDSPQYRKYFLWAYYRTVMGWLRVVAESTGYIDFLHAVSKVDMRRLWAVLRHFPDVRVRMLVALLRMDSRVYYCIFRKRRR